MPTDEITVVTECVVKPFSNPNGQLTLNSVMQMEGAPNGFEDKAPFAKNMATFSDPDDDIDDARFMVLLQASAIGVEVGTFDQVQMTLLNSEFLRVADDRYRATTTWTATKPGAVNMIGFDVSNDFRGYAQPSEVPLCPGDCDNNGNLNILDFVCFQNKFTDQNPEADCDGNGQFNILDFVCYQNKFTAGCG
jgi:hypothetical protein